MTTIPTPERIRQIRESLGETQHVFANRLSTHANQVSRWELGKCRPRNYNHVATLIELDRELARRGD